MGSGGSSRPAPPPRPIPPVSTDDRNVQLAGEYEEDRLRRRTGASSNKLLTPEKRAASSNLLISQTTGQG